MIGNRPKIAPSSAAFSVMPDGHGVDDHGDEDRHEQGGQRGDVRLQLEPAEQHEQREQRQHGEDRRQRERVAHRVVDLLVHARPPLRMAPPSPATRGARRAQPLADVCPPAAARRRRATVRRRAAQGPGRQPWRDRHPRVPRDVRARHPQRRRLHARRPRLRAPRQGRRGVRDRRDGPSRAGLPRRRPDRRARRARRRRRRLPRLRLPLRGPAAGRRLRARRGSRSSGPSAEVLRQVGNKVRAREAARAAGLPVAEATEILDDPDGRRGAGRGARLPALRQGGAGRRRAAACGSCARPARSRTRCGPR